MGSIASQITNLTIVYSFVYSDADQRKHQSSASLAFVRGMHRGPVNSPHKGPVTRKMFPFDDVIIIATEVDVKNRAKSSTKSTQSWYCKSKQSAIYRVNISWIKCSCITCLMCSHLYVCDSIRCKSTHSTTRYKHMCCIVKFFNSPFHLL